MRHTYLFSILSLVALGAVGCSTDDTPPLGEVSGTVTIDGQPTEGVYVSFKPVGGGRVATAKTDASGQYRLLYSTSNSGAKVGEHEVKISGPHPDDNATKAELKNFHWIVPLEYEKLTQRVVVEEGGNTIDLDYPPKS
ncbi:carboxypeptidase-like regulatory domain-containing protein [Calycomorphotria hydatis]|uniref:Carboxypeptidase regulatory-like domain-containing protein n=1 Tax=Calycomorphotria hydatis TaxID=2528027 RepID=A0A517TD82_9PLAN|nr:carboxypeptidase-like regulatory domain-containing protein [Calycomorphotria hydatis]QDT66329.1 hypothetical protein V22_35950 [Calycomorphotria hydatis]